MQNFYGKLTIGHIYSFIETHDFPATPRKYWLLYRYSGDVEDSAQAGEAATLYIEETKHIPTGALVIVTGMISALGSEPVIIMEDINTADRELAMRL